MSVRLYGKIGGGVALLDDLELDTVPPPAVDAPWWKSGPAGFASARIGLEYRLFRHLSLFVEAACCAFLPQGGSDWPGAKEASAFVFAGGRAGIAILI